MKEVDLNQIDNFITPILKIFPKYKNNKNELIKILKEADNNRKFLDLYKNVTIFYMLLYTREYIFDKDLKKIIYNLLDLDNYIKTRNIDFANHVIAYELIKKNILENEEKK